MTRQELLDTILHDITLEDHLPLDVLFSKYLDFQEERIAALLDRGGFLGREYGYSYVAGKIITLLKEDLS